MIIEPVVSVILHCSRCNTALLDTETESPACWASEQTIAEEFRKAAGEDVVGWRRDGDRYLCEDCHIVDGGRVVEKEPLRPVEQMTTLRMQQTYAWRVDQLTAYLGPAEATR
jgi:hypothetical protein